MKLPSIPYLANVFSQVLRRFPFVMLAAFTGCIAAMMLIDLSYGDKNSLLPKILLTAALGLPTLLSAALAAEKWQWAGLLKWAPTMAALALLALYFSTFSLNAGEPGTTDMIRFTGLNLFAHLLVAYLPYLDNTPVEDFWEYNKRLFGNFVVGVLYSIVIFGGLSIAILAVDNLFDLHISGDVYAHLFVLVAGIFNTAFFLANFPAEFSSIAAPASPYTTAIKNLSKFILIPIVGIYFLILYAYSVKILATWELPHGWVSSLVLGFSVAGIFTYLLNYLLVKYDANALVKGFRKWFFYVLLPMVGLLFVAIGKRLSDYGVTEERFVVATAGVWLLLMSLYFIFSKKDNIKFIPISLSVFALLTVLGPFSAFRISGHSQADRLKMILEKNAMIKDGKAVPAKDTLAERDAESIRSILYYMREHEHFDNVKDLFPGVLDTIQYADWNAVESLIQELNVGYSSQSSMNCGYNYQITTGINVDGFEKLWQVQAFIQPNREAGYSGFTISEDGSALDYYENGEKKGSVDLQTQVKNLSDKYTCYGMIQNTEDVTLEGKSEGYQFKLVMESLEFRKESRIKITGWSGVVLVKELQNE
ncbi:MAG: DUF4153 domain-containing protein [Saprospiraceae bacterium]